MKILFVASEAAPYVKTGGLGDVLAGLPPALAARGHDIRLVLPRYRSVPTEGLRAYARPLAVRTGTGMRHAKLLEDPHARVPTYFIEHDAYFDRGGVYGDSNGSFGDNVARYAFLSAAALSLCRYIGFIPDIIHANDWQTALIPALLRQSPLPDCRTVLTIHNIGYQGRATKSDWIHTGLSWDHFNFREFEHHDALNLLKGGIALADQLTTVSPTHAWEIQTADGGHGLENAVRARAADLTGILNGIDESVWDPLTDPLIPANYGPDDLTGKAVCKRELQRAAGLPERPEVPLIGAVSRLTYQKGTDVLLAALRGILQMDVQMVFLGSGDSGHERQLSAIAGQFPGRGAAYLGYSEPFAHRIEAGADLFLMPSRYEPCGLNQLYSQCYGTPPIVRSTGGLADSVDNYDGSPDRGTGFVFQDLHPGAIVDTVGWAVATFYNKRPDFEALMRRGMARDFSWSKVAGDYESVYRRARA